MSVENVGGSTPAARVIYSRALPLDCVTSVVKFDETVFYQQALSKFWPVSSVSSLLTIGDRHCTLGIRSFFWVGSGFVRQEGGGMGQVK